MTSVVVIADSGAEMARLTAHVHAARGMTLVRHASGRAPVGRIVADHAPTLILLGELSPRQLVLDRLAEIRSASPASKVVVVAADATGRWLGTALAAGASAVVLGGISTNAIRTVLHDVLGSDSGEAVELSQAA
jgi:DNA-binding NarL/FixJ family response regulator